MMNLFYAFIKSLLILSMSISVNSVNAKRSYEYSTFMDCALIKNTNHPSCSVDDSSFIKEYEVIYLNYKLIVQLTFFNESVSEEELHLFKPAIINQKLLFFVDDIKVLTCEPQIHFIDQKLVSGKEISMPDNQIYKVAIICGTKGYLYKIEGYCGANSCDNFSALYSMDGKEQWSAYIGIDDKIEKEIILSEFGNYHEVLLLYGITSVDEQKCFEKSFFPSGN